MTKNRWAQQNSGHDLAQHRRLVEFLHNFPGELGGAKQYRQGYKHGHYIVRSEVRHQDVGENP